MKQIGPNTSFSNKIVKVQDAPETSRKCGRRFHSPDLPKLYIRERGKGGGVVVVTACKALEFKCFIALD